MLAKPPVQPAHARRVATSNRRHLDYLSGEQLDPIVFAEDGGLGHLMEFVDGEQPSRRLNGHEA